MARHSKGDFDACVLTPLAPETLFFRLPSRMGLVTQVTGGLLSTYKTINANYYANKCKEGTSIPLKLAFGEAIQLGGRDYTVRSLLGTGSFGRVYSCRETSSGSTVAIKFFGKGSLAVDQLAQQEAKMLAANQGPGIVRILAYARLDQHVGIVMEQMLSNTYTILQGRQKRGKAGVPLLQLQQWGQQLANAVAHLHANGVGHCDIKPENILVSPLVPNEICLADLSNARTFGPEGLCETLTTRHYRSPAQLLGLSFGLEDDLWSIGCVLHEWYTGAVLLPGQDDDEQLGLMVGLLGQPPASVIAAMAPDRCCQCFRSTPDGWVLTQALHPVRPLVAVLRPLLTRLLCYQNRLTAAQLAQHPFWA